MIYQLNILTIYLDFIKKSHTSQCYSNLLHISVQLKTGNFTYVYNDIGMLIQTGLSENEIYFMVEISKVSSFFCI
jgi:hypothetical protein